MATIPYKAAGRYEFGWTNMGAIYGGPDMITNQTVRFSPTLVREARPDGYASWLTEGLIKYGEGEWFQLTTEMAENDEWPFIDDKTIEEGYSQTGCTLGHIEIAMVDSQPQSITTIRQMRIMPSAKEFINYQSKESDMTK